MKGDIKGDGVGMNVILILLAVFIIFLVGFAGALDFEGGVEMMPGERAAMERFEHGFGTPWVGGEPPRGPIFEHINPQLRSIHRPGFLFTGYHWPGVQISPFRACHPFCDCGGQFYYSRSYFYGLRFQE
jgi:hypothetical protein